MTGSDDETTRVTVTVRNATPIAAPVIYALVDVDLEISGVLFSLVNVQARRLPNGGTEVVLPRTRRHDGAWVAAIALPSEVGQALTSAVLAHLIDEGLAHNRLFRQSGALVGFPPF